MARRIDVNIPAGTPSPEREIYPGGLWSARVFGGVKERSMEAQKPSLQRMTAPMLESLRVLVLDPPTEYGY
jgi:hypothetical protein